jgi:hypothetical protein
MSFKLTGVVKKVGETIQVSEKFSKRELVVTDSSTMYPQDILFEFAKDKTSHLDSVMEGQEVEVSFNLRGRMWTSPQGEEKYFNTLDGWRVDVVGGSTQAQSTTQAQAATVGDVDADGDLPF